MKGQEKKDQVREPQEQNEEASRAPQVALEGGRNVAVNEETNSADQAEVQDEENDGIFLSETNKGIDEEEEAVLDQIPPSDVQELEGYNQDTTPSFGFEGEEQFVDVEQQEAVEEETATETRENDGDATVGAFSAYLAPTPEETRQSMLANAVEAINVRIHPSELRSSGQNENKWKTSLIILVVVVAIALGISLGVTLSGRNKEDSSTSVSPTPAPTSVRFGEVVALLDSISNVTSLLDPSTPQYQAAQWMANEDELYGDLADVDPERFGQRYVMALLYFATGGPTSWVEISFFLKPNVHECEWRNTAIPNTQSWSGFVGVINCSSEDWVGRIEINQNNLTGTLPTELGSLLFLAELTLFQNSIGGTLPASLFDLSDLRNLTIWSNEFTGTIPTEVGQATSLEMLSLPYNSLTGTLPSEIGKLTYLKELALGGNFLTGTIPTTLLQLSDIAFFDAAENALTGTLPPTLWSSWPNLRVFGMRDNSLSGTLSQSLDSVPRLEQLILLRNNFTGPFPSSVVKLSNVTALYLWGNDFTGSLPNDWTNLSSTLVELEVSMNRLTGTIPETLGSLTKLMSLTLFSNDFNGTIPANLGNLTALQLLGLGDDSLTGTVPTNFVKLSTLQMLTLDQSELTGDLSFLCNGKEMLFPYMTHFYADCSGEDAEVICPCCNYCCNIHNTCDFV